MNDSNSMLRFRESFRGYNKDDVNAYIEQVNARFSRRESDLRAQIADLQNRMPAPAANTADDGTKKRLEAAETENAKLKAELEELKNSAAGNSEKDEKSRLYDSMSSQVGNILIVANSNADKIRNDAEEDAKRIKAEAELEAEKIRRDAETKMNTMIDELEGKLKSVSDSYLDSYANLIADSNHRFTEIPDSMKARSEQLLADADNAGREIGRKIADGYCGAGQEN